MYFFSKFASETLILITKMRINPLSATAICAAFSVLFLTGCGNDDDKNSISMSKVNQGVEIQEGTDYEFVDLGLPSGTLWAKCNIGATSPEKPGSFFAWGETQTKDIFNTNNYKWCNDGILHRITKYNVDPDSDLRDDKRDLELADDAANVIMGEGWQIPTVRQYRELMNSMYCTSKWCKLNGTGGYLFTSVVEGYEGRSIFIPIVGYKDVDKLRFADERGYYWCNSLYEDKTFDEKKKEFVTSIKTLEASTFCMEHLDVDNRIIDSRTRYLGLPIRPVLVSGK